MSSDKKAAAQKVLDASVSGVRHIDAPKFDNLGEDERWLIEAGFILRYDVVEPSFGGSLLVERWLWGGGGEFPGLARFAGGWYVLEAEPYSYHEPFDTAQDAVRAAVGGRRSMCAAKMNTLQRKVEHLDRIMANVNALGHGPNDE